MGRLVVGFNPLQVDSRELLASDATSTDRTLRLVDRKLDDIEA